MTQSVDLGFIGGLSPARSVQIDCEQCINFYPELEGPGAKNVRALIGVPGKARFATIAVAGAARCLHTTANGRMFAAIGSTLCEVYYDGRYTVVGSLLTVLGAITMADNGRAGNQLVVADGTAGYVLDLVTNEFVQIPDFCPNGTHVIFKDQYFLMNSPNTGRFYASGLLDGLSWDALVFATAEGSPDNIVAIAKTNNELWLFGEQSAEVWYNAGAVDFPFVQIPNAFIDVGTEAPASVAVQGNDIFWLGSNNRGHGIVWHAVGYQPERISTHGIEYIISQMSRSDDAIGYCYQQEGHFFYVLNFPTANRTLVYDQASGLWHERQTYNERTNIGGRDRGSCHTYAFGKHIVGDFTNGNLYELDLDTYTDDGAIIQGIRSMPHAHANMKRIYYYEFEADMEKGVGSVHEITQGPFGVLFTDDFSSYSTGAFTGDDTWDVTEGTYGTNLVIG
jgi:hypothetical protein